jgi:hypothetical protein
MNFYGVCVVALLIVAQINMYLETFKENWLLCIPTLEMSIFCEGFICVSHTIITINNHYIAKIL